MTSWLGIVVIVVAAGAISGLIVWGVKRSGKSGRQIGGLSAQAKALAKAERKKRRAETVSAQAIPVGPKLRALARKYRHRRLRDMGVEDIELP